MKDIIEIVKSLEYSGLLLKGSVKQFKMNLKNKKGGFLSILLGKLGASLLGNILARKGVNRAGRRESRWVRSTSQGRGIARAGYGNKKVRKTTKNKMDF